MTRIELSKSKRKFRTHPPRHNPTHNHNNNNHHHHNHHELHFLHLIFHKRNSMRRQFKWQIPSIVLLLASCLVFVILLTLESGYCSNVLANEDLATRSRIIDHQHNSISIHDTDNDVDAFNRRFKNLEFKVGRESDGSEVNLDVDDVEEEEEEEEEEEKKLDSSRSGIRSSSVSVESQQVPEQALPIVVSSSDNSYVSASPIETHLISTPPISAHLKHHHLVRPRGHRHFEAGESRNRSSSSSNNNNNSIRVHRARLRSKHLAQEDEEKEAIRAEASSAFSSDTNNNNDIKSSEQQQQQQQQQQQRRRRRRLRHWNSSRQFANMHNRLFGHHNSRLEEEDEKDEDADANEREEKRDVLYNNNKAAVVGSHNYQPLTSSDISTTATTTQRNKIIKFPKLHLQNNEIVHHLKQQQQQQQQYAINKSPKKEVGAHLSKFHIIEGDDLDVEEWGPEVEDEDEDNDDDGDGEEAEEAESDDYDNNETKNRQTTHFQGDKLSSLSTNERMQTMNPSFDNSRPSVGAHYNIRGATILKTRESIEQGATFINYTLVTNLNACLVECWITDNCDTAIYQESPVDFSNHLPYLINNKQRINHNTIPQQTTSANARESSISLSLSNLLNKADNLIRPQVNYGPKETDHSGDDSRHNDDDDDDEKEEDEESQNNDIQPANLIQIGYKPERGFFICYLFQCSKPDGFKCQFSAHNYYVSSISKQINVGDLFYSRPIPSTESSGQGTLQIVEFDDVQAPSFNPTETHYLKIINQQQPNHWLSNGRGWHDSHVASIRIGQEDSDRYDGGGLNSAIIALLIGVCATGILIMIVGHKMRTIRRKIAYKGRRRSLVPDADFLINTMPI